MLVLTRRKDESIMIGDDIKLTVTKLQGGKVSLAFQANKDVKILRQEVYDQMQSEVQK